MVSKDYLDCEARPGTTRYLVEECFEAGYSINETAEELGISTSTVRNALYAMGLSDGKIPKRAWRGELGAEWTKVTQFLLKNGRN